MKLIARVRLIKKRIFRYSRYIKALQRHIKRWDKMSFDELFSDKTMKWDRMLVDLGCKWGYMD